VQAFPPSHRFGEARRSAERGGGRPAVSLQNRCRAGVRACRVASEPLSCRRSACRVASKPL